MIERYKIQILCGEFAFQMSDSATQSTKKFEGKHLDKVIKFSHLCSLFEMISKLRSHKQRIGVLEKFWEKCIDGYLYPFIRLTIPQVFIFQSIIIQTKLDNKRMVYNLKESKIANYYIELLCIPKDG